MQKHLRQGKKFPHVWCSGCGIGIIMGGLIRAIESAGLRRDRVVVVSGIGCSSRMPIYLDYNTLHTTHGRAIAFSTGIKMARPELEVIVVTGDGDAAAIGGNHLIHAARRNIGLTVVCINNNIYGMTGGQASPTTPEGDKATTAAYGAIDPVFDLCELTIASGAAFVARTTTYHARVAERQIAKGIEKKGFSFIEIVSQCPTYFGRFNQNLSTVDMLLWQKEHSISKKKADKMQARREDNGVEEELGDKFVTGVLVDRDIQEYTERYDELIKRVSGDGR
ncbi:MAG: 2-oxoacid:ferredoxin oxidoreductase subunit beta [bacterium]|nr:2-oxoacid:ferredoxin oxidoreductase subunit beta [bacterium]